MSPEQTAVEHIVAAACSFAAGRFYRDSHEPGAFDDAQAELEWDVLNDALHAWREIVCP